MMKFQLTLIKGLLTVSNMDTREEAYQHLVDMPSSLYNELDGLFKPSMEKVAAGSLILELTSKSPVYQWWFINKDVESPSTRYEYEMEAREDWTSALEMNYGLH